jgi:hypothetical protein
MEAVEESTYSMMPELSGQHPQRLAPQHYSSERRAFTFLSFSGQGVSLSRHSEIFSLKIRTLFGKKGSMSRMISCVELAAFRFFFGFRVFIFHV